MTFEEMVRTKDAPARRGLEIRRRPEIMVGGLPAVSLLPRELKAAARDRSVRRLLVVGVAATLVVALGGTAGAMVLDNAAQSRLASSSARSQQLVAQLGKFKDVQQLQQGIALGGAAAAVGDSTEIDWNAQIQDIKADMPSGYSVQTVTADSASAIAPYPQGTTPLEQPRAATLAMTVTTQSILELPIWLRKLRSIPAYADATANVSSDQTTGYSVLVTIHLSPKALVNAKVTK